MNKDERFKNDVIIKIHGGGTGLYLFLSITIFFWIFFAGTLNNEIKTKGLQINYEFIKGFLACVGLCGVFSAYTFTFWKFNFIELRNDRLIASVLDRSGVWNRSKRTILPKFIKTNILFEDIKLASFIKSGFMFFIKIIGIDSKEYLIDVKWFSKASCLRLFQELGKKGVKVDIEHGTI